MKKKLYLAGRMNKSPTCPGISTAKPIVRNRVINKAEGLDGTVF
jgi:hypothetical protein